MLIPLTKNNVAVLTPQQLHLLQSCLNSDYKIRTEFLLQTSMRISEAYYVSSHPECFREDHGAIFLPRVKGDESFGKARCKHKERAVLLSPKGIAAAKVFFEMGVGLPTYQAMEEVMKRAAKDADIDPRTITTKMLRKTFISWVINSHPELRAMIASSAGHTTDIMDAYYITYGFRKEDKKDMIDETAKWGEA